MLIYNDFIVLTLWELSVTVNQVVCLLELDFVSNSEKIILKMSQVRLDDRDVTGEFGFKWLDSM